MALRELLEQRREERQGVALRRVLDDPIDERLRLEPIPAMCAGPTMTSRSASRSSGRTQTGSTCPSHASAGPGATRRGTCSERR